MAGVQLYDYQEEAITRMKNGCILSVVGLVVASLEQP